MWFIMPILHEIFGSPDDMKLKSSMTLFSHISPEGSSFEQVLAQDCLNSAKTIAHTTPNAQAKQYPLDQINGIEL